jgi:heme oxygenase (biliverdin-IX-beta and delta-forming)
MVAALSRTGNPRLTETIDNAALVRMTARRTATDPVPVNQPFAQTPAASGAIDRLRQETGAAHRELDENLDLIDRLSSVRQRANVLAGYHRFHHAAEAAIAPFLGAIADLDFAARRRSRLIADGIGILGQEVSLDRATSFGINTRSEAFGAFYVLEGSSLGGRVILKELKRRGASLAGLGFLDPYGFNTAARWRSFLAILEREVVSGEQQRDAVTGALNAFTFAKSCLSKEITHERTAGRTFRVRP